MIFIPPKALAEDTIAKETLREDKTNCLHYEDFGLGKKALYVGMFGISRVGYIPLSSIERVYKRLGVTKGFFEEGKIYGTLCYLVVIFDGREKAYRFTHEENLDRLLDAFRGNTSIPVGKK
ncbi:MAG: hypothetical protein MSA93_01390 [Spirochaetales bacterium]|nr:hypothetical protein [Spirochaetales bacterium]